MYRVVTVACGPNERASPLRAWFHRVAHGSTEERSNGDSIGSGKGVPLPENEDRSLESLPAGLVDLDEKMCGGEGGGRTHTYSEVRQILSLVRLPIPPLRLSDENILALSPSGEVGFE